MREESKNMRVKNRKIINFSCFFTLFFIWPLTSSIENTNKKLLPSRKLDLIPKGVGLVFVPKMYLMLGTLGTYLNVPKILGTYFMFFLKTPKGTLNISYFYAFSYIFSLFFNSEIKKLRNMRDIYQKYQVF